jgi:hypothetical protein
LRRLSLLCGLVRPNQVSRDEATIDDEQLAEYNAYLARINATESHRNDAKTAG